MAEYGNDSDNLINLDQQYGTGPHTFHALAGNDRIYGGTEEDRIYGGDDDDSLLGRGGADLL